MNTVYIPGDPARYPNYFRAVRAAGAAPCWMGPPLNCDALLLPGGGDIEPWRYGQKNTASCDLDPQRDTEELALLDGFTAAHKPVLGICRGLQVINVYFGGTLVQNIPNHSTVNGMDRLHLVKTASSPLRSVCGETCLVNSAHHQAIDRPGTGLTVAQWAPDGIIEAIEHRALPVLALQWHPERLGTPYGIAIFRLFLALLQ